MKEEETSLRIQRKPVYQGNGIYTHGNISARAEKTTCDMGELMPV